MRASNDAIPELATPRVTRSAATAVLSRNEAVYEAGSVSRRTINWRPPTASPNANLGSLGTIRDRSRAAVRNNGFAKGIIDELARNIVGWGIKPLSQAPDPAVRAEIQRVWNLWVEESSPDVGLNFYGQQFLAVRCWLEAGESFARKRFRLPTDGLTVPLQIELLEPELCPYTYTTINGKTGNRVRAGIEMNAIGKRIAYHFHPSRPQLDDFDASQLVPVSSDAVVHLYEPLRAGQLRGLPVLTQALVKLQDLDKFDDATLLRQQIGNLFALFIKRDASPTDFDTINPLTGQAVSDASAPLVQMEPGTAQELNPGEDVEFSDPPDPPASYADFMRQQLRSICVSVGVPYEILTGDMTTVNDRTARLIINKMKRGIQMLQYSIVAKMFCEPIWQAFIDRAVLSGALVLPADYRRDPKTWTAVKWMPQRWAYLHPVQDVEADREAIRAGFTTRSSVVSEYGEDADAIDAEQAADNARADELGLKYSSDGRVPASGNAAKSPAAGDPAPAGAAA